MSHSKLITVQLLVDGAPKLPALIVKQVEGCNQKYRDQMKIKKIYTYNEVVEYAKIIRKYE